MRFESQDFMKSHRQWRESRENPTTKITDKIKRKNNSIHVQKYNDRSGSYYSTKLQQKFLVASNNDDTRNDDDDNNKMNNYFDKRRSSISRDDDDAHRRRREKEEKVVLGKDKVIKERDEKDGSIFSRKELEYLKRSRLKNQTVSTNNDSYINSGIRDLYNGIPIDQEYSTDDDNSSTQSDYYYTTTDNSKTTSSENSSNKGLHLESFTDDFAVLYEECSNEIRNVSVNAFLNVNDQIRGKSHTCTSEQKKRKKKSSYHNNYNSKEGEVKLMNPGMDTIVDAAILYNILPNHVWFNYFLNDSHDALIKIQKRMLHDYNHDNDW